MLDQDSQTKFREAMEKAGLTDEFLLERTQELISAIDSGKFKPRHKEFELRKLKAMEKDLIFQIQQKRG